MYAEVSHIQAKKDREKLRPQKDSIEHGLVDSIISTGLAAQNLSLSNLSSKKPPMSEIVANFKLVETSGIVIPQDICCAVASRCAQGALAEGRCW